MDENMDENKLDEDTTVDADEEKNIERISANKDMTGELAASVRTILSVAGIDQTTNDPSFQAQDFDSNPETSLLSKVRNYFSQLLFTKEGAAKCSDRASRVLEIVAEASGIPQIKASSLVFKETAAYLTKKNRKDLKERAKQFLGGKRKSKEMLSEQERDELLNIIGQTWEELDSSAKSEFNEIKKEIKDLQGSVKLLLDMVANMNYLRGCEYIHQQFDLMSNMDLVEWVNEFYQNKNRFSLYLADFKEEKVKSYLSYVYKNKCSENMQPMFQAFGFLVNSRELYKLILTTYYTNITDHIFDKTPNLNPLENVSKELEKCEKDLEEMEKAADSVVGVTEGGFIAMMKSKENLGFVPRFQDISDDNYVGDFSQNYLVMMPMDENEKYKLFSNEGKEALQSPRPLFIKCKSTNDDYETIVAMKDGVVHRATGFRTKFKNGSECLGKVTSTNVLILYIKAVSNELEIYSNGNVSQWKKELVWKDSKEKKRFTEYFGQTPEYYIIHPKVAKRIKDKPGVDNKDKKIKLWLTGHRPLLAQRLEESGCMLQFLDNTSGPSPLSVISQCYKQLGLILLKEKVEGSDKKKKDFLEIMQEDRDSFATDAAVDFNELKTKYVKTKFELQTTLEMLHELWPSSNFKWILDKVDGMLLQSDMLPLWASMFHRGIGDFQDKKKYFDEYKIGEFLKKIFHKKCEQSLEPLYCAHRFLICSRSLYSLLHLTYLAFIPEKFLEELPGLNPFEEAIEEIEATELYVRKITDVCNSVLSGFFEAALCLKPEWKLQLCYVPDFADIPRTDENFVKDECWNTLQYGGSYNQKKNIKVYQTQQVPGFTKSYNTDTKQECIYRYEDNKVQDGGYRDIFNSGNKCFGQRKFAKSLDDGEENREYCLYKYAASGNIQYQEYIWVHGQDEGWRYLTRYTFNPDKLEWNKVN